MTLGTERENIFSPRGAINYLLSDGIPSLYARIQIKWYEIIRFFSHVYKKKQRERSERNHVCQQNYNGHSKQCYTCSCCGCHNVSRQSKRVFFSETKDGQITMGPLLSSTKSLKILGKGCKLKKKKKKIILRECCGEKLQIICRLCTFVWLWSKVIAQMSLNNSVLFFLSFSFK